MLSRDPRPGTAAIMTRGLRKHYPENVMAVDGLDLEVKAGECFGLLGPNGAGKTTTIEILEGLLEPTGGEVEVLGRRWGDDEHELRQRIGISLQETHLIDKLTVLETLQLFRSFYREGLAVDDVLRVVSLEDKRDAWYEKLSGGQKQRVALACALVGDPELLFLDEPTTGLDPQSRRQLWEVVLKLRSEGRTVLLTTHYMDEAERLCDRVAIVDRGKVIAQGTPQALIASTQGSERIELALTSDAVLHDVLDEARLTGLPGVHAARQQGDGWTLSVDHVHVAIPALMELLAGAPLARMSTHRATLEDVFVDLTGRQLRE